MKTNCHGYSVLELLIAVLIISILIMIALPYYQNAVQSARNAEVIIGWGRLRNTAVGKNFTQAQAERITNSVNEQNQLKHFTFQIVCRPTESQKPCWEAVFNLKEEQTVQYYLTTQQNFQQLACVPQNNAGDSFCQSQSGQDNGPDTQINGQPAYIIRH